jgi:restriction system protein
MSVPKFFEFFEAFLNAIQDGELHTAKEVRKKVAEDLRLSSSDLAELVLSGRQTTFGNRINWGPTYSNKAGLI